MGQSGTPASPTRVLIADDGKAMAMLLQALVARWGYEAIVVHDGLSALDVLRNPSGPRLALLDWEMPGIDGPDVCRALRKLGTEYAYLILLTAKAQPADTVTGL